jgi:hypothetical protein
MHREAPAEVREEERGGGGYHDVKKDDSKRERGVDVSCLGASLDLREITRVAGRRWGRSSYHGVDNQLSQPEHLDGLGHRRNLLKSLLDFLR